MRQMILKPSVPGLALLLAALLFAPGQSLSQVQNGVVTGRLVTADGSAAVGVRVSAMSSPVAGNGPNEASPVLMSLTETDREGRFRLADVPPGRYFIMAGLVEFPTFYPGVSALSGARAVNVTAGTPLTDMDFRVERISTGLTVSGRIRRESNQVVGGSPRLTLAGEQYLNTTPKLDGSFEFVKVRPGNYMLSVEPAPGFQPRNIVVTDRDVSGLEVVVPWAVEVRGVVAIEGGGPQPMVSISFSGGARGNTVTQMRQTFQVTLAEGAYGVTVSGIPSGYYLKSMGAGGTDLISNPLNLSRTSASPEILVTLGVSTPPPWVKLSGRVTGMRPSTSLGALNVYLNGPIESVNAAVAPDGSFEFPRILPGNYTASLRPTPISVPAVTIMVPNQDLVGIEFAIPAAREVTGRIDVEDGAPLPRVVLRLNGVPNAGGGASIAAAASTSLAQLFVTPVRGAQGTQASFSLNLQPDGSFSTSLPEGEYRIVADIQNSAPGAVAPYSLKSFAYGATDLLKDPLIVTSADSAALRLTYAPRSNFRSKVSGRVGGWDPAALPPPPPGAPPAAVSLSSPVFASPLNATINPDGSFEFLKVYPGDYTARLTGALPNMVVPPTADVHVLNADVTGVDLVMPRQREISGRIVLEGRGVMPRIGFPLTVLSARLTGSTPSSTIFININPQPDGTFKITVPEGEREVGAANGLPAGYAVKTMLYGSTDLVSNPLKVLLTDTAEFRITVLTPDLKPAKVAGKVVGLDAASFERGAVTVTLMNSAAVRSELVTAVARDGSFEFAEVFAGNYSARVAGPDVPAVPVLSVSVGAADIRNIEIVVPGQKEITGRVIVEGPGPLPRFAFRPAPVNVNLNGGSGLGQFININPRPDGTFTVTVTEGEHRLGAPTNLPAGYVLKSATYGTADLMRNPLKVSKSDTAELLLTVTAPARSPVTVSGRVEGLSPTALSQGSARVTLNATGYVANPVATVKPDGTFEISSVFPGNYTARITPGGAPGLTVVVSDADIKDLRFVVAGQRTLSGRIVVEGGGPIPRVGLLVMTPTPDGRGSSGTILTLNAQANGTFRLILPEGERQVSIPQLPLGYALKSLSYGDADLRRTPLRLGPADAAEELRITLERTTASTGVAVRGRVTGLASGIRNLRVSLSGNFPLPEEVPVSDDGSFTFLQIPPGVYSARLIGGAGFPPSLVSITVGATDVAGVLIEIPKQFLVRGHVVVDGAGSNPVPPVSLDARNTAGQIISSALANGSFSMAVMEGEQRITVRTVPSGYVLQAVAYGSADLLKTPLKITAAPDAEIVVRLSAASPNVAVQGVNVGGKVTGMLDAIPKPVKLLISGPGPSDLREVAVAAAGKFELQRVLPGTYTLRVSGVSASLAPATTVVVAGKDITNVTIAIPFQVAVLGQVEVEGGKVLPKAAGMIVSAQRDSAAVAATVKPDGSFMLRVAEGDQTLSIQGVPEGYLVKSIRYRSRDITGKPLKVSRKDSKPSLRITLAISR